MCRGGGGAHLTEMRRHIDLLQATAGLRMPYYRALLADACLRLGLKDEGLSAVTDGLAIVERTEERWWAPELHRLRGELLSSAPGGDDGREAARCFTIALDLARRHQAKSLELRAARSLARVGAAPPA